MNLRHLRYFVALAREGHHGRAALSCIVNGAQPGAAALESYILSAPAQVVLAANGFGPPAPVPEPPSAVLLALGIAGLAATGARRRRETVQTIL